jgi:hypothetical protein
MLVMRAAEDARAGSLWSGLEGKPNGAMDSEEQLRGRKIAGLALQIHGWIAPPGLSPVEILRVHFRHLGRPTP